MPMYGVGLYHNKMVKERHGVRANTITMQVEILKLVRSYSLITASLRMLNRLVGLILVLESVLQ